MRDGKSAVETSLLPALLWASKSGLNTHQILDEMGWQELSYYPDHYSLWRSELYFTFIFATGEEGGEYVIFLWVTKWTQKEKMKDETPGSSSICSLKYEEHPLLEGKIEGGTITVAAPTPWPADLENQLWKGQALSQEKQGMSPGPNLLDNPPTRLGCCSHHWGNS